ncbi:MAG: DUF4249 domain-containing protein [Chryseolinea sp.]
MRGEWSKLILGGLLLCVGCLDPYSPPVDDTEVNILVVDGFFDTSGGIANVSLSKAIPLSSDEKASPETSAAVTLLDQVGSSYQLHEDSAGHYSVTGVPVQSDAQYRIHIRTQGGNEYQSSLMEIFPTPPIDSIGWITDDEELTVRINTHDFSNRTKYFKWSYEETWAYHAEVLSMYKVVGKKYVDRQPNEMIFYCYKTQPSTNIIIGSTVRLSENIISQAPLIVIPKGSQKLSMKYSMLITQRGLSEEEYTYLDQLRRTTESVGGLFDPQPSQVPGNIQRLDPSSPLAIGFFGVGNTVKQRIFIDNADLPVDYQFSVPQFGCYPPDTVCIFPTTVKVCNVSEYDLVEGYMLGQAIYVGRNMVGITLSTPSCADWQASGWSAY